MILFHLYDKQHIPASLKNHTNRYDCLFESDHYMLWLFHEDKPYGFKWGAPIYWIRTETITL